MSHECSCLADRRKTIRLDSSVNDRTLTDCAGAACGSFCELGEGGLEGALAEARQIRIRLLVRLEMT